MKGSLLLALLTFGFGSLLAQPATIFSEDFDGGLNQFTANPGVNDAEAIWRWSPNGEGDSLYLTEQLENGEFLIASFWGDSLPGLNSPTFFNGAALFNSDAYDSNGIEPGEGPYPTPHTGELVSPAIDCSDRETVALSFYQFTRTLFDNYTNVEVSIDGGISWNDSLVVINQRALSNEVNSIISPDTWTFIDISEYAAGEPDVRIRFTWLDADYYFWLIDDVMLTEAPEYNVTIENFFYPLSSFGTPVTQIPADTFGFSAHIVNYGTEPLPNAVVRASVYSTITVNDQLQLGDELFADSTILEELPVGYNDTVSIENNFIPELAEGRYIVFYEVYSEDEDVDDYYPFDNVRSSSFMVTPDLYSKDNGFLSEDAETPIGYVFNEDYKMGNLYTMSNLAEGTFAATEATFAAGRSTADGSIANNNATIILYRVKDRVNRNFGNFNLASTGDASDETDDLEQVGFGSYIFPENHDPFESITVPLEDLDGNEPILDAGARYLLVASYADDANKVSHLFADDYDYPDVTAGFISSMIYAGDEWGVIDLENTISPIMRMTITMSDAIDETPLPETSMMVFPNPANEVLSLQLELEAPTEAVVIITDLNGRILQYREYEQLQGETLEFDVRNYASGQYMLRLGTELGSRTKKFIVAH